MNQLFTCATLIVYVRSDNFDNTPWHERDNADEYVYQNVLACMAILYIYRKNGVANLLECHASMHKQFNNQS